MYIHKYLSLIIILLATTSCAWLGLGDWGFWGEHTNNRRVSSRRSKMPKVSHTAQPGGANTDVWRYLGVSDDGLLTDEINAPSIKPSSGNSQIYSFMDRKMVVDTAKFSYPENQPHFKYLLATWQINCSNQTYIINTAKSYDASGTLLRSDDYSSSGVKWLKLGEGSFADMQYKFVCLGINRNLGY